MRYFPLLAILGASALLLCSCNKKADSQSTDHAATAPTPEAVEVRNVDIVVVTDPVREEIWDFKVKVRQRFNNRDFKWLELTAAQLRKEQSTFDNGSWKIEEFYEALLPARKDPDSLWELHEDIRRDWIEKHPESITAKVAMMDFYNDYAWRIRGGGFANTVKSEAWPIFHERLKRSFDIAQSTGELREQDPVFYRECLTIALGLGLDKSYFDDIVNEAHRLYPTYWSADTSRANSLLPRWYGEPGDWEAFALETASRPDGLQDELYARIVNHLCGYYDNVFLKTDAQWENTRNGLDILLDKYPRSVSLITQATKMVILAKDQEAAQRYFYKLNNRFLKRAWKDEETFRRYQRWANGGPEKPETTQSIDSAKSDAPGETMQ